MEDRCEKCKWNKPSMFPFCDMGHFSWLLTRCTDYKPSPKKGDAQKGPEDIHG